MAKQYSLDDIKRNSKLVLEIDRPSIVEMHTALKQDILLFEALLPKMSKDAIFLLSSIDLLHCLQFVDERIPDEVQMHFVQSNPRCYFYLKRICRQALDYIKNHHFLLYCQFGNGNNTIDEDFVIEQLGKYQTAKSFLSEKHIDDACKHLQLFSHYKKINEYVSYHYLTK